MNNLIIEEIINYFGRTGSNKRARIRKFHAELLLAKILNEEYVISKEEFNRNEDYIKRIIKFSKGYLKFINEEALEVEITKLFVVRVQNWIKQYTEVEELDHSDEGLEDQGIIIDGDQITFDGKLSYSRFYKIISDEGEAMNNPKDWVYSEKNLEKLDQINFSNKNSPVFTSKLFVLKFYILRKVDEVAFVTSRFVHCPKCGANYVVSASKIDFQQTYRCEKMIGGQECGTALKKFPARKMLPTYIYEIGVEVKTKDSTDYKEFFLESFTEFTPGYYSAMCFGRTERKSNTFYFSCLLGKEEISRFPFEMIKDESKHNFFNLAKSVQKHIQKVGFVIDEDKAQLPILIETLKKIMFISNKEINLAHSLYFGAPGIGKTYSLTLVHHLFYSNSGFVSGPRFTIAGLTGGQREIFYQDMSKKKNVPGLFSMQAFIFDEINNAQFLKDDKAVNLFKSVALSSSGTSTTVGGKEFPRTALISASANYNMDHLTHYENKIKKLYASTKKNDNVTTQATFLLDGGANKNDLPENFDFYCDIKNYDVNTPKNLVLSVLKVRDNGINYLTGFPKPLMERFYFSILVHPKYDKRYMNQKAIDVKSYLKTRNQKYSNREMISKLFAPDIDGIIKAEMKEAEEKFNNPEVEEQWSEQTKEFLMVMNNRYHEFFSMFNRISNVHVFALYALTILNNETYLSFETKRIYEKIISLLHKPIEMKDFHTPDFDNFVYAEEGKKYIINCIEAHPDNDLRNYLDFSRQNVLDNIDRLIKDKRINKLDEFKFMKNDI